MLRWSAKRDGPSATQIQFGFALFSRCVTVGIRVLDRFCDATTTYLLPHQINYYVE